MTGQAPEESSEEVSIFFFCCLCTITYPLEMHRVMQWIRPLNVGKLETTLLTVSLDLGRYVWTSASSGEFGGGGRPGSGQVDVREMCAGPEADAVGQVIDQEDVHGWGYIRGSIAGNRHP